jgi:hypothetical protein
MSYENIPSKIFKKNKNLPWMTKSLRRMVRRKVRLQRAARKSKQWIKYKKHQKECKKQFHKAEAFIVYLIPVCYGVQYRERFCGLFLLCVGFMMASVIIISWSDNPGMFENQNILY